MGNLVARKKREPKCSPKLCVDSPSIQHPVDTAGWFSFGTFSWMSDLMYVSYKDTLKLNQIPTIPDKEECRRNTDVLEQLWREELAMRRNHPTLRRALWKFVRRQVLFTSVIFLTSVILGFLSSVVLLKRVLDFASDPEATLQDGAVRVAMLIVCELLRVFFFTTTWALSYRTAIGLKTACMGLINRKIFRLANCNDHYTAKLINVISSDCHKIYDVVVSIQVAIGGPITLILGAIYISVELGMIPLVGMLIFPASYPLQFALAKGSASLKRISLIWKDSRVSYLKESLQCFKFLKMFAWEKHFSNLITHTRRKELSYLFRSQMMHSFSIVLSPMLPHVGAIVTFILYISSGKDLTPAQAFCVIALYSGRIRPTLNTIRMGFRAYLDSVVSVERIQGFTTLFLFSLFFYATRTISRMIELIQSYRIATTRLQDILSLPESPCVGCVTPTSNNENEVVITAESLSVKRKIPDNFGLRKSKKKKYKPLLPTESVFYLQDINLSVRKGSFIGICGQVGSGKTTFVETLVGLLPIENGTVGVTGKIAYVPQEPWLFNGTLRDNILFGEPFEAVRYYNVINSCCLVNDFGNFGQGDLMFTDDKGSNLSGGQRQRIAIARALYHSTSRDIFVLDNPFSGLDDRVANSVFERVIMDQLWKRKTVLLVTHQLHYLRRCDEVIVFSDGRIVERGTFDDLSNNTSSQFSGLMIAVPHGLTEKYNILLEDSDMLDAASEGTILRPGDMKESITSKGSITWDTYCEYAKSAGGPLIVVLVLLIFAVNIGSTVFSSWWLKSWFRSSSAIEDSQSRNNFTDGVTAEIEPAAASSPRLFINSKDPDFKFYRDIYAGIIAAILFTSFIRTLAFVWASIHASKAIHKSLVKKLFESRLRLTEKIGTGELLQLFTRDIGEVDCGLPHSMEFLLQNICFVIAILFMVSLVFPVFIVPLLILFGIFIFVRRIYNAAIRDLKRFESDAKTPILNSLNELVSGMGTIRAFGKEQQMTKQLEELIDRYNSIFYAFVGAARWLSFRLDVLAVSVIGITAIFILLFHGRISPAACGLALSYAAQLSGVFQVTVRMASELEAKFVSVERIKNYLRSSHSEASEMESKSSGSDALPLHPNWPFAGKLKFDSVTLNYASANEAVLRDVSFEIREGSKVGIVGRTGSGKSSLGTALFRLSEIHKGAIYLDDVNISDVPLQKLRNVLCVIPQEPAVFQNSVRFNLDPNNVFTDDEIWNSLEKVGLKSVVDNLDMEVPLSQGQKQLLSVARAILRRSVVLFVDEATSNVDQDTAAVIDKVILNEFASSTVLVIAHRLEALKYCEYLLVMEDGEVRDFGPVEIVTKKPGFLLHFENFETVNL